MANGNGTGIRLSKTVVYTDGNGFEKTAIITGTRDSVREGTAVPRPDKGRAHLRVLNPVDPKRDYVRTNVPLGEGARSFRVNNASA